MSLVYFGSVPSSNQLVSKENSLRGINLCRQAPSALSIVGLKEYTHPNYETYLNNLASAVRAARTGRMVQLSTKENYYLYDGKNVPTYTRDPRIVWNYGEKKTQEFLDAQKARFNCIETTAGGKPALSAILTVSQVRSLVADTSPLKTTSISLTTMNIDGFYAYRKLHAVSHALLRCQQYALTGTSSKLVNDRAQAMVAIPNDALEAVQGWGESTKLIYDATAHVS
jgi:hypothetical protein